MRIKSSIVLSILFCLVFTNLLLFWAGYYPINRDIYRAYSSSINTGDEKVLEGYQKAVYETIVDYFCEDYDQAVFALRHLYDWSLAIPSLLRRESFYLLVEVGGYLMHPYGAKTEVLSTNGVFLYSPSLLKIGRSYTEWRQTFPDFYNFYQAAISNGLVVSNFWFATDDASSVQHFHAVAFKPNGQEVIVSYSVELEFLDDVAESILKKGEYLNRTFMAIADKKFRDMLIVRSVYFMLIEVLIVLVGVLVGYFLAQRISRPLAILTEEIKKVGHGNFNVEVPLNSSLEINTLAETTNQLGRDLALYIDKLGKEIKARQTMENDLKVASYIQQSMLPKVESCRSQDFSLGVKLVPAQTVAGDFYNFFYRRPDELVILIADVAGKGLPAAFFMAAISGLLHHLSLIDGISPDRVLQAANKVVRAQHGDYEMFASIFLGFYNVKTGRFIYSNGGHNYPVLLRKDGLYQEVTAAHGVVVGVASGLNYEAAELFLESGDFLVFYTDGVTEATAADGSFYGEERFLNSLLQSRLLAPQELCDKVVAEVLAFEEGNIADDITILALRR